VGRETPQKVRSLDERDLHTSLEDLLQAVPQTLDTNGIGSCDDLVFGRSGGSR
jgi:hypothetical protein